MTSQTTDRHPDYTAALRRCDGVGHVNALAERAGYKALHGHSAGENAMRAYYAGRGVPFARDRFSCLPPGGVDAFLDWLKAAAK